MDCALERGNCLVVVLELLLNETERQVRRREVGVELNRVIALFERGVERAVPWGRDMTSRTNDAR